MQTWLLLILDIMPNGIYEEAFYDELEKLGFKFPWQKKKRRRRKKETWKEKFASSLDSNIKEYNIDTRLSKGIARFMFRRGI